MDKDVIISLKGIQTTAEGSTQAIELMSEGKFYKKDKTFYVVYKETEITGLEGTTTTIKVSEDIISLIRFGTVSSTLVFQTGVRHICSYGTNYGFFEVAVEANEVRIDMDEDGGELYVDYEIELGGERLGYNNFHIKIHSTHDNEID